MKTGEARKRSAIEATVQEEVARSEERAKIKRRRKELSSDSTTQTKRKMEACAALKALLAERVTVTTTMAYVNTRPKSRLTISNITHALSVKEAVDMLLKGVFDELASNLSITRNKKCSTRFTPNDIELALTLRLMMAMKEYQQDNLSNYWSKDNTCPFDIPMGREAFKRLNAHIDGSTDTAHVFSHVADIERKIINILTANFRMAISPNNIWSFDELVFPHQTLNDPLVAFLPRKPHALGIIAYLAAIELSQSKLPFILYILPVTTEFGISGPHAFQSFLNDVQGILGCLPTNDLHVVVDALFSTAETVATASSLDIRMTWSQNGGHKQNLLQVLSDSLPKRRWRLACVPSHTGPDQHFFVLHDSKVMVGGSTAFQICGTVDDTAIWGCTPDIARNLAKLEKSTLTWLVTKLPDLSLQTCGSTEASMVTAITGIPVEHWCKTHPWIGCKAQVIFDKDPWEGEVKNYANGLFTMYFAEDKSTYKDIRPSEVTLIPDSKPNFAAMTLPQLKVVANKSGMKVKATNKEEFVKKLSKNWPFPETLENFIGQPSQKGTLPPFHNFYSCYFNLIDRFNRFFYQLQYPHKQMDSGPVRVWSLLNLAVVQSWSLFCEVNNKDPDHYPLKTFVKDYINEILGGWRKY